MLLAKTLKSSTLKQALIWIVIFGAMVLALFGYVYWSTVSYARGERDRAIAAEMSMLQTAYATAGQSGLVAAIARRVVEEQDGGGFYLLAGSAFDPLAGNLEAWPPALNNEVGWTSFAVPAPRTGVIRATFAALRDGTHLLVGRSNRDLDEFVIMIDTALALGVALVFALAGLATATVTRRTVGRIEAINATSRTIMRSGLGQRIPLRGTRDEWDELAANLNSMLERIETLVGEVKQVTDNVAHDLRTPLTRMRGRLEKASNRPRDDACDQQLIGDTMADLDNVLGMFASLTRISQIEAADRTAAFRPINLADIAHEVVELFEPAAEEAGGHLEAAGDRSAVVTGDRDLLFDAVANLVDNAIKHGRAAGRVTVAVKENGGGPLISVADDGPGIPAEECEHVFKRFYRLEQSRRTPGNGLGLSLVAAVARLHGARIEVRDNAPGAEFRLWFPGPATGARSEA